MSDYLDLIEVAEEHETCISWYMGKLPLHTEVPEMFEDVCNARNGPWRRLEASSLSVIKCHCLGSCLRGEVEIPIVVTCYYLLPEPFWTS